MRSEQGKYTIQTKKGEFTPFLFVSRSVLLC